MKKGELKQYMHVFSIFSYLLQKRFGFSRKYFSEIKYSKFIASFLITLVIMLPFYTANVYAADKLTSVTVKNKDNIENFVNGNVNVNDHITYSALANIDGDAEITPNQTWVEFGSGNEAFDSCSQTAGGEFTCAKRYPSTGEQGFSSSFGYTVRLYRDADVPPLGSTPSGTCAFFQTPAACLFASASVG